MYRLPRRPLSRLSTPLRTSRLTWLRYKTNLAEVDSTGIPLKPTWSVHELLSSYPRPTVSPATLKRLHELSALIPPLEGTPEHAKLSQEMEELVRLVEAVKLVDVNEVAEDGPVPDGRIWASGEAVSLNAGALGEAETVGGRSLLQHASRTVDGLYVVEADKPRN
ncbi:hypothetical protein OH76DRAFT_1342798 [Lentinus brumalis]|uniref:Uncharacterized protein n=1 Tax=Lentinus brumalis TaxID=2498619 RepID=A0A371DM44_9APHY|nr:hypothetical protein OH76DRAFT_1342798 [Polyporus brumalis]